MTIAIRCSCGKTLRVKEESVGKKIKCPNCGEPHLVQAPTGTQIQTHMPPKRPKPALPPAKNAPALFALAAAGLAVLLVISLLGGSWFVVQASSLKSRLLDAE